MSTTQAKFLQGKLLFKNTTTLPIILQDEAAECGHACITMISNYLGHEIDLYTLRKINRPSNRGVTLLELNQLLADLGFKTRALRVPLEELHLVKSPAILHWNMNHFVVLKSVKKNSIIIHDPSLGIRRCSMLEVSQSFTGIVLEVEKSSDFTKIRSKNKLNLMDLVRTIRGIHKFLIALILLSLSIEILSLLNPLFMQYVTDNILATTDLSNLYVIAFSFIILLIIQFLAEYARANMVIFVKNNLTEQFASNIVQHILKLPLDFFEKRHIGDLQSKFNSIEQIQKKISTDLINTVLDGLMMVVNLSVMLIYSPVLTLFVVFSLFVCLLFRYSTYYFLKNQTQSSIFKHAKSASIFLETLKGIMPIKSFLKEHIRFNMWRNYYVRSLNADIKIAKLQVLYDVVNQFFFQLEHIVVICVGATLVLANKFSVGMLIAFLAYRLLLVAKASSFIGNLFDYKLIAVQLSRLSDIVLQQPESNDTGIGEEENFAGSLLIQDLSFKYNPNEDYILQNINLSIAAGEKIAIVGSSGCGKSTFLKILLGLLEKTEGDIFVDKLSLESFGIKNYRKFTAAVMQEDSLFSGSILDNIAFFDEDIDILHVYEVAKLACIHDEIIKFPMRYETLVGDMGSILSGGQKQRILLARALYKKPKILFLDEATSHLDSFNEKKINDSLKSLAITQIIIAHRQETIQMADRVINLELLNTMVC